MHRINLKLGLVVKLHLVAVPVRVPDKFDVLALSGTMEAIITGSPSTNVIWEQLEGTPVTFTTPLNQLSIGFTTTDYEYKLFKCTTNPNTDVERSAVGHFYHYPVDTLNIQRTSSKFHTLRERSEQPKIDIDPGLGVSQYFPRVAVKIEQNTSNHTRFKITKGSDVKITNIKITASNDGINYITLSDGVPNRLVFADLNYEFLEFEVTTFDYGILNKKVFTFNNISSITSKKSGATDLAEINDLAAKFTLVTTKTIQTLANKDLQDTLNIEDIAVKFTSNVSKVIQSMEHKNAQDNTNINELTARFTSTRTVNLSNYTGAI